MGNLNGEEESMKRRSFLGISSLGWQGTRAFGRHRSAPGREKTQAAVPEAATIKEYRTLGRTGFKASDIAVGVTSNVSLLKAVLDAGVNCIDTSEEYGRGQCERVVGEAIEGRDRKSLFITTKIGLRHPITREIPGVGATKADILRRVYKSLERLKTDYVDCLMIPNAEDVNILKSEEFHSAAAQLKAEGRVRFVGASHHGSQWEGGKPEQTMETVLTAAADDGRFDVMLLAYNFLKQDMGEKVLEVCRKKDIGTALMKTNPVREYFAAQRMAEFQEKSGRELSENVRRRLESLQEKYQQAAAFIKTYGLGGPDEIRAAAIRFCLSNPDVHTVCHSFQNFNDVRDIISLSGGRLSSPDKDKLSAYAKGCGSLYCRHACGLCEPGCPFNVPINTIMRYHHYFEAQGREKYAMEEYATLPGIRADLCLGCEGGCQSACPHNVPIHGLLIVAHQNLAMP
jgi:predicted aldo/keto reductase-like oxidoreductase